MFIYLDFGSVVLIPCLNKMVPIIDEHPLEYG